MESRTVFIPICYIKISASFQMITLGIKNHSMAWGWSPLNMKNSSGELIGWSTFTAKQNSSGRPIIQRRNILEDIVSDPYPLPHVIRRISSRCSKIWAIKKKILCSFQEGSGIFVWIFKTFCKSKNGIAKGGYKLWRPPFLNSHGAPVLSDWGPSRYKDCKMQYSLISLLILTI